MKRINNGTTKKCTAIHQTSLLPFPKRSIYYVDFESQIRKIRCNSSAMRFMNAILVGSFNSYRFINFSLFNSMNFVTIERYWFQMSQQQRMK